MFRLCQAQWKEKYNQEGEVRTKSKIGSKIDCL